MPRGVPGTPRGYALGHPGAVGKAVRAGLLPSPTALQPNGRGKQSTRYLAVGANIATCNDDIGQYGTDLGLGTGSVVLLEASTASARFDFGSPRTMLFRVEANNTDTGTLYRHGAASPDRLLFSAANTIAVVVNNSTVLTYTVTGLTAARKRLIIAWCSEDNDDTTGAANAVQSWLLVWNVDDGTFDSTRFTHALSSAKAQTIFFGAADNAGVAVFSGTITAIHFESRRASATEIAHDWVSPLTPPTTETKNDHQGLPVASTIGFAAQSAFHGPAAAWACDATRRLRLRLLSPLWNEPMRISTEFTQSELYSATDPWIRGAPDSNTWRLHLTYLRAYPVPPWATHLWVRVQFRSYLSSGTAVYPTGVRLYSMSRNPSGAGPALVHYHVGETIKRIDTGEGSYVIKAKVPIAANDDGWTYLAVGLAVDPDDESGANPSLVRMRVQAVHAVPNAIDNTGGLGGFAPGWGS
jgi:hypothetical protein